MSSPQTDVWSPDKEDTDVKKEAASSKLQRLSAAVHDSIENVFLKLTAEVVERPVVVIVSTIILGLALAQGIWFYDEEFSTDKSYTPRDSQAVGEEEWVESVYGRNPRRVEIYFSAEGTSSVLTREGIGFMFEYAEHIRSTLQTTVEGEDVTYDTICSRYQQGGVCKEPKSILDLWGNQTAFEADADFLSTINSEAAWRSVNPTGAPVTYYMGGMTTDTSGAVAGARSTRIIYSLRNERQKISGKQDTDLQSYEFELALAKYTQDVVMPDGASRLGIAVYSITDAEEQKVSQDAVEKDTSSFIIGYMLMFFYASFILFRGRVRYSHAFLGVFSVGCVALATFSAYGMMWYIGVKFNGVTRALILLLLGVGVDDTFVIMDSWWAHEGVIDLKERMKLAMKHAGPAVFLTTATDLVAFLVGSSTSFPALRDFCYYAAAGLAFDFFFQVTLFVAAAFLDTRREEASRMDILCCVKVTDDTAIWPDGPPCLPAHVTKAGIMHYLAGVALPRAVLGSRAGKMTVLSTAAGLLAVGIYGCTQLEMDFQREWFVPDGAVIHDAYDHRDDFYGGGNIPVDAFFSGLDFTTAESQVSLLDAVPVLESDSFTTPGSVSLFMSPFITFLQTEHPTATDPSTGDLVPTTYAYGNLTLVTSSIFLEHLRLFASTETGPLYARDFIEELSWSDDKSELTSVRISFLLTTEAFDTADMAVDALDSIRETTAKIALPDGGSVFSWTFVFVYFESFKLFVPELTQNVLIAGFSVLVLVSVVLANLYLGLLVAVIIGCIDVCLLGFMPIVSVYLNSVSVICIMIAIGLSVDYSVHVAHSFLLVSAEDNEWGSARSQRAAHALWKMGPAVFNGGLSTFIAILPLAFSESFVFIVFFRMFALIIAFGQFFGIIFLPVLLSLVGPPPNAGAECLSAHPRTNPLDPRFHSAETPVNRPYV